MILDPTFRGKLAEAKSFDALQAWLDDFCESSGMPCWHNYGPADLDAYLSRDVRILLFGAESWGYNKPRIERDTYLGWLNDRNSMPSYAGVLITLLREFIECARAQRPIPAFEKAKLSTYYQNRDLLKRNLEYTIYANARISSKYPANGTSEEVARIAHEARLFAPYRRRFVEVMQPEIIVCGGLSAQGAVFVEDGPFAPSRL